MVYTVYTTIDSSGQTRWSYRAGYQPLICLFMFVYLITVSSLSPPQRFSSASALTIDDGRSLRRAPLLPVSGG